MSDFDELIKNLEYFVLQDTFTRDGSQDENLNKSRTALTDAISAVTSERDALKDVIEGKAKLFMEEVMPTPNGFDIIGKHPLFGLFVHSILELFAELKADNYFEMQATRVDTGDMVILFQKKDGKTPHELRKEAEQERDELKAKLAEANEEFAKSIDVIIAEIVYSQDTNYPLEITGVLNILQRVLDTYRARLAKDES